MVRGVDVVHVPPMLLHPSMLLHCTIWSLLLTPNNPHGVVPVRSISAILIPTILRGISFPLLRAPYNELEYSFDLPIPDHFRGPMGIVNENK